jgi:nicotinamide riboside kinase
MASIALSGRFAAAPEVEAIAKSRRYDLTFLTAADFQWVDDGSRNSDGARRRMQRRFAAELARRQEPVVELRGSVESRTQTAVEGIDRVLGLHPPRAARLDGRTSMQ